LPFAYPFAYLLPTYCLPIASTEVAVVSSFIQFAVQITDQNDDQNYDQNYDQNDEI
jgi:hypothetical protein